MVSGVEYKKANNERLTENLSDVKYDVCDKKQKYCSTKEEKNAQRRCSIQYKAGAAASSASTSKRRSNGGSCNSAGGSRRGAASKKGDGGGGGASKAASTADSADPNAPPSRRAVVSTKCYFELPRARRAACTKEPTWYHKKYVRDECGSGIVPRRFNIHSSRRQWCKTPLSMYQATIGELGRQILCGEVSVPRDVWHGPPCNMDEYIMPRCLGYYRKYECVRPCPDEHVLPKHGQEVVRDRVERYWNPCLTKEQRVKLDVNAFAPHNAYLGSQLRRMHVDGDLNAVCW